MSMGYRTIEIIWMPDRPSQWATYTAARTEAARLRADLVARHHRLRRLNWGWPSKATVQWRNKRLASAVSKQSTMVKGSRRWRRVQRRKKQMLAKARRRMNDLIHKATHRISQEFPGATCYVGKPFNDASRTMNGVWAQQVSQASNGKITRQFDYKTSGAIQVDEHYSSQTCPRCGVRNKCRRVYRCRECGIVAPRDVVGSTNILCIGLHEEMWIGQSMATEVVYVRPIKVSRNHPSSSVGHTGNSSA